MLPAPSGSGLYQLGEHRPRVDPTVWIAPTAAVIGRVEIGPESSVWFGSVIRGDYNRITIGSRTNIQDGTIIHADPDPFSTSIGDDITIGHGCIIHGCTLQNRAFVGMGATVLNGCVIEEGGMLGAGALLSAGKRIGRNELWVGMPAQFRRKLTEDDLASSALNAQSYVQNAARFRRECSSI